jgi:hypothetical protein
MAIAEEANAIAARISEDAAIMNEQGNGGFVKGMKMVSG